MQKQISINWKKDNLEYLLDILIDHRGITPKKLGGDWSVNGIPALSAKNIKTGKIVNEQDIRFVSQKLYEKWMPEKLEDGDILLTSEAPLGELYYLKGKKDYVLSQRLFALRTNRKKLNSRYLYFYLQGSIGRQELLRRLSGTAAEGIRQAELRKINVEFPEDILEQEKIASVISAFDDKIEVNNKIAKTLEEMAQAIFKEWFVNFKFYGWEKEEFINSELGKMPKAWSAKFPDIAYFQEGPGIRNWQYRDIGTPFINIRCFKNDEIDLSDANYLDPKEVEKTYTHFLLNEGDFIVSSSGTLGRIAKVRKHNLPLLLNTSVIRIRPKDGFNGYCFIKYFLKSPYFQNQINAFATGSAQPNYGPSHLKQLSAIKPDKHLLDIFESITEPMENKLDEISYENQKLITLRDLLLPKLMRGEVRV